MPAKLSSYERGRRWAVKNVKDGKLYPVMNNAIIQSEKTAYTRDEFNRQEFFRGVAIMCKTRIQNNMKRKEVIV